MAEKHLIGLDIGTRCIKALQLTASKKDYRVTDYVQAEIPSPESLPSVLSPLFSNHRFATKQVVSAVSGKSVTVRYITMPLVAEKELHDTVKYELGKYIPFEVDEVFFDYQKLEELPLATVEGQKEMHVLLVAAKKALVDEHVGIIESTELQPTIVDVDAFALGNAYLFFRLFSPSEDGPEKGIALIDLGASKATINILYEGRSYFAREFYKAGDSFTDIISKKLGLEFKEVEALKRNPGGDVKKVAECLASAIDEVSHDISLSIDFFENQYDKKVEIIYLSGGSVKLPMLTEILEHNVGKKVAVWNPFERMNLDLKEDAKQLLQENISNAVIALGLASRIRKG